MSVKTRLMLMAGVALAFTFLLVGIAIFALASVGCALAPSIQKLRCAWSITGPPGRPCRRARERGSGPGTSGSGGARAAGRPGEGATKWRCLPRGRRAGGS